MMDAMSVAGSVRTSWILLRRSVVSMPMQSAQPACGSRSTRSTRLLRSVPRIVARFTAVVVFGLTDEAGKVTRADPIAFADFHTPQLALLDVAGNRVGMEFQPFGDLLR